MPDCENPVDAGECRLCGALTHCVVNINFEAIAVCEDCCRTVAIQTVTEVLGKGERRHDAS